MNTYALTTSGQVINYEKSYISSSKKVKEEDQEWVRELLGVLRGHENSRYLDLPSLVGRSNEILDFIYRMVVPRINNWPE